MMDAIDFPRPAPAGRAVLALAFSLALHAALLLTAAGKPDGGIVAGSAIQLPANTSTALQVMFSEQAISADEPETADIGIAPPPPAPGNPGLDTSDEPISGSSGMLPLIAAPRYYLPNELDARPQIRTRINPAYPKDAAERGITAELTLRVFIDEQGRVENVVVPGNNAADPFVAAAIAAFKSASYTPGIKDGVPVRSLLLIGVSFEALDVAETFRGSTY